MKVNKLKFNNPIEVYCKCKKVEEEDPHFFSIYVFQKKAQNQGNSKEMLEVGRGREGASSELL